MSVATRSLHVGAYALEVGPPVGSFAHFEPKRETENARALDAALAAPTDDAGTVVVAAERIQESAAAVTGRIEQARSLSQAAVEGRLSELGSVSAETDLLLSLAERLDRAGRFKEELRLLRAMHGLLVVSRRWLDLIRALRRAISVARAAGDQASEAWALHELGTLHLGAGDANRAAGRFAEALRLKEQLGDAGGRCVTRHNLDSARRDLSRGAAPHGGGRSRLRLAGLVVGAALLALVVSLASRGSPPWSEEGDDTAVAGTPAETETAAGSNRRPQVRDDNQRTREDQALVIPMRVLLGNDRDPDGDALTVNRVSSITGTHGEVSLADGRIVYRPDRNANGSSRFRYAVTDGNGGRATALVNVTVESVNDAPNANADALEISDGIAASVDVLRNDRDVDGDLVHVVGNSDGERGDASCSPAGSCTYSPEPGTSGPDIFTYTIEDGNGGKASALVQVTVTARPHVSIDGGSITEGGTGAIAEMTFAISLSAPSESPVTVDWQTGETTGEDTATGNEDFREISDTVVFRPGDTTATIAVQVIGDDIVEFDERFVVVLLDAANADVSDEIGYGTIMNDDAMTTTYPGMTTAPIVP